MIARKATLITFTQFFARFLGWIGLVVMAKLWDGFAPYAFGVIGFAMSFLGMFNILADLGFYQAHVKRISEGKDLGRCIGTYAFIKILLTGFMVAVVLVSIFVWKSVLHRGFTDATTESVIYVLLIYYVFANLYKIPVSTFEGRREIAKRQFVSLFENLIKVPLEIMVATAGVCIAGYCVSPPFLWPSLLRNLQSFISRHVLGSYAMSYVLGAFVTLSVGLYLLSRYPLRKPSFEMLKSYFSFALPIMLISIISVISVNIDKVMIGYFWTSKEVGYYFSVQQILQVITIISTSVGMVLFPTISGYHANRDFGRIKRDTIKAERYISMFVVPVAAVIIAFSRPLINIILSSSFLPAAPVLIVLTVYAFVSSLNIPYSSLIKGINRPDIGAKIGMGMCIANILFNYLFIPREGLLSPIGINGPTGASFATLCSALLGFFSFRIISRKLAGIEMFRFHLVKHVVSGIATAGVLYLIEKSFPSMRWYYLVGFSLFGVVIYLGLLALMREFKKEDLRFLLEVVSPKGMFRYIREEIRK